MGQRRCVLCVEWFNSTGPTDVICGDCERVEVGRLLVAESARLNAKPPAGPELEGEPGEAAPP